MFGYSSGCRWTMIEAGASAAAVAQWLLSPPSNSSAPAAVAAGLDAKRVGWRQDLDDPRPKKWQTIRVRHAVIHERTRQGLARGWIDDTFFPHRLAYPLGDAAMGLPVHDQRVDAAPDVVHDWIAGGLCQSGFGIDLNCANPAS